MRAFITTAALAAALAIAGCGSGTTTVASQPPAQTQASTTQVSATTTTKAAPVVKHTARQIRCLSELRQGQAALAAGQSDIPDPDCSPRSAKPKAKKPPVKAKRQATGGRYASTYSALFEARFDAEATKVGLDKGQAFCALKNLEGSLPYANVEHVDMKTIVSMIDGMCL